MLGHHQDGTASNLLEAYDRQLLADFCLSRRAGVDPLRPFAAYTKPRAIQIGAPALVIYPLLKRDKNEAVRGNVPEMG